MRQAWKNEDGFVAVWVAIFAAVIVAGGGLLYDVTDKANQTRRATMIANEAGRAAAQELSADVISGTGFSLDTASAADAARAHLSAAGVDGTVIVEGTQVIVTTHMPWSPSMMPLPSDTLTGTATINAEEVVAQ